MQYIIESAICLSCMYVLYWFALRRETFFQWNRAYLLLAPLAALAIPALHIRLEHPETVTAPAPVNIGAAPAVDLSALVGEAQVIPNVVAHTLQQPLGSLTVGEVLQWIYFTVTAFFLVHLAVQLYRMLLFIRRCKRRMVGDFVLTTGPADTPIASFFGFVFWHPGEASQVERRLLLEHEMVHVRQWHTLDLILMELLIAFQWFNPLLYAYRRSLRTVHEYIADDYVVRRTRQRYAYARLLASRQIAGNRAQPGLVNTFFSRIQNRLVMLAKHPSHPLNRVKYFLSLPLFAALFILFSFRLVERLPETQRLHQATNLLETYATGLSEMVVPGLGEADPEFPPYKFFWGALIASFRYEKTSGMYEADIAASPEEFREAIKREPRLWDGKAMIKHFSFSCGNATVQSDTDDESVYQQSRRPLEELAGSLTREQTLQLRGFALPDGKPGLIRITLAGTPPNWLPRQQSEIYYQTDAGRETGFLEPLIWGNGDHSNTNRQYFTVAEFFSLINTTPKITGSERAKSIRTAERFNLQVTGPDGKTLFPAGSPDKPCSLATLRSTLENIRTELYPGVVVWITGGEQSGQDDAGILFAGSVFVLVNPADPRLFLTREDQQTYYFEWGNLSANFGKMYARSFRDARSRSLDADHPVNRRIDGLQKSEILRMLRLPARLYCGDALLPDINFTVDYNGYGVLVKNSEVPADLIEKLERELKSGDVLRITGFQARTTAPRWITCTDAGMRAANLRFEAQTMKVCSFGEMQLIRLAVGPESFGNLRDQLQEVQGAWFQYGDIDLSTVTLELVVRHDQDFPVNLLFDHPDSSTQLDLEQQDPAQKASPAPTYRADENNPAALKILLSLIPNPASADEQIKVGIVLPKSGTGLLTVTDVRGEVVYSLKTDFNTGYSSFQLPLFTNRSKGLYVVRLEMPYDSAALKLLLE